MDFIKLATERYSVRKFENKPVENEVIEKLLKAASVAPTGCNYQPQRILVINSEEALAKLPGKDALIVQLIWTLQGNVRNLAYALNAIKEKMEA